MAEVDNQETVKETQNPDFDKSPLASALFRHINEYYANNNILQQKQEQASNNDHV